MKRTKMPNLRNGSKAGFATGLDCESDVVPLSYRAPHNSVYVSSMGIRYCHNSVQQIYYINMWWCLLLLFVLFLLLF